MLEQKSKPKDDLQFEELQPYIRVIIRMKPLKNKIYFKMLFSFSVWYLKILFGVFMFQHCFNGLY